jgi:NADH-quinone oxidoreductase subunit D
MHGVIRIILELDGEVIVDAEVEIGYLHRAFEKHCENGTYTQAFPYTDRLNYVSPLINNFGYALAVEKLWGIEVPERCQYIRVIMSEISRIADHLTCIGASGMELGAFTVFLYCMKAREFLYELIEAVTGARITISFGRIGGVKADLPEGFADKVKPAFAQVRTVLGEIGRLLTNNRIFVDRMKGVGAISKEDAIQWGFTGPMLRATGVYYDVRKAQPYLAYDRIEFEIPLGENGDNYDRYLVRMAEMEQSMRIVERALVQIPDGPIAVDRSGKPIEPAEMVDLGKAGKTKWLLETPLILSPNLEGMEEARLKQTNTSDKTVILPPKEQTYANIEALMQHFMLIMDGWGIRPPKGEVYFPVEAANGELGFYIVSDGTDHPYRVRARPPCYSFVAALASMIKGGMVADVIPTFGSVNMIAGELDR